jgi:hypothetical protein
LGDVPVLVRLTLLLPSPGVRSRARSCVGIDPDAALCPLSGHGNVHAALVMKPPPPLATVLLALPVGIPKVAS